MVFFTVMVWGARWIGEERRINCVITSSKNRSNLGGVLPYYCSFHTLLKAHTHFVTGKMAGATTTTARQLVRVAGAVAGAGLAVSLWPPDEEDGGGGGRDLGNRSNVNNNNNNNLAKRPQYPRVHLLKHLDVRLVQQQQQPQQQQSQVTTAFFRPPPSSWLVPTTSTQQHVPSSSLQAHEQQQDEDGAKDMEQQQQKQQHPLIFISCADPFVMENLVQDVLELR